MTAPATASVAMLPDWTALRARTHPEHLALDGPLGRLTYVALEARVASAAGALRDLALERDEPVGLLMGGTPDFAVLAHAVPRSGGTLMPLNARLSAEELAWQLRDARGRYLIADAAHIEAARAAVAGSDIVLLEAEGIRWEHVEPYAGEEFEPDRPHSVIYTSGTTGRPKGAVLTHGNFYWSAVGSAENLGQRPGDRWLACMPLFHVGGLSILLRSAIYGTTAVLHDGFDESAVNAALRDEGVTLLSVVATMLRRMLDADRDGYPSTVRAVLLGGGPAPRELLQAARDRGLPVLQTYGLTEAASQVATLAAGDALDRLGSAGLPLSGTTIRVETEGRVAAAGEVGEILAAGATVTPGYLHSDEATAEALRDGWLHTGDLGYIDGDGYLYVADRRDDLIVSGGENVYPAEVEAALLALDGIEDCAVVGLPDERWGQAVAAVIVTAPEAALDLEAVTSRLRESLAGYKLPRRFELRAAPLPRTASGKLQRHLVREWLIERQ